MLEKQAEWRPLLEGSLAEQAAQILHAIAPRVGFG